MSSSGFAALCSAFGKYDVVHIHAEGPAFFAWLPKLLGKRVVVTIHGIDWQREKWQSGLGSKFIHQGEKNAAKYADEVIVLSKGVQDYFKETYGRETHFIPNGVNRPQIREASLITDKFGLKKDSYISKSKIQGYLAIYFMLISNQSNFSEIYMTPYRTVIMAGLLCVFLFTAKKEIKTYCTLFFAFLIMYTTEQKKK